jgi:nitroimidazol reductase NimA-like FMN-containing flavoprotein (pyridoxamine 5'-phosphate oxidase superfamily)
MAIVDSRPWMERLSLKECWEFLASTPVGRVGVVIDTAPEVYPVNHSVDGESIVFRTDPGGKLRGLHRTPSVCFQIDDFDSETRDGWSVLLKGRATEVVGADAIRQVEARPLEFWDMGSKCHWVRIVPSEVTGRRIHQRALRRTEAETTPG